MEGHNKKKQDLAWIVLDVMYNFQPISNTDNNNIPKFVRLGKSEMFPC